MAELDEHLQRMTAEKEEAMTRATRAEIHNVQLEKDRCSVSTQLDVSTCSDACLLCGVIHNIM